LLKLLRVGRGTPLGEGWMGLKHIGSVMTLWVLVFSQLLLPRLLLVTGVGYSSCVEDAARREMLGRCLEAVVALI